MKNKTIGSYLAAAATVLSLVAVIFYGSVLVKDSTATVLMAAAAVLALGCTLLGKFLDSNPIASVLPILVPVLITFAIGVGIQPMVDQLGFVAAGLDPYSTISALVNFIVCAGIALVVSLISCFVSFEK